MTTKTVNRVKRQVVKRKSASNGSAKEAKERIVQLAIPKANLVTSAFKIVGKSPYVQQKFSQKAKEEIKAKQLAGSTTTKSRKKREPKNFKQCYEDAMYKPQKGNWRAIPATAIKASMVAACRLVDFKMTDAKQCIYIEADGYDKDELTPLIKITKGKPKYFEQALRIPSGGTDVRARPMWEPGWEAVVRITYDADRFTAQDVLNLLARAGSQVGIGEGRQASRMCVGLGWGSFEVQPSK